MDENPYNAPREEGSVSPNAAPMRRRLLSTIVLGIAALPAGFAALGLMLILDERVDRVIRPDRVAFFSIPCVIASVALAWFGLRLRRPPSPPKQS
jgi:hypothetical protein